MNGYYFNKYTLIITNNDNNIMGVFYKKYNKIIFRTIRDGKPLEVRLEHTSKIVELNYLKNWSSLQKPPEPNVKQKINCIRYKELGEVVEKLFDILWRKQK